MHRFWVCSGLGSAFGQSEGGAGGGGTTAGRGCDGGGVKTAGFAMPRWQVPQVTACSGLGSASWVRYSVSMEWVIFIMTRARSLMGLASEAKLRRPVVSSLAWQ